MSTISDALEKKRREKLNRQRAHTPVGSPLVAPQRKPVSLRLLLITAAIGLVLGGIAGLFLYKSSSSPKAPVETEIPAQPAAAPAVSGTQAETRPAAASIPEPAAEPEPLDLTLEGIFYTKGVPGAIINGTVVRAGDTIEGAKILSISSTSVSISYNGATRTLRSK